MTATLDSQVKVSSPSEIEPNPENPRLIFREKELLDLEASIAENGILVPLTVFRSASKNSYVLLDGERRWRCAKKLGLHNVPIIVQPEPSQLQNIMMMFAIHNARTDWDPLPTALKLQKLEDLYADTEGHTPSESQLAQLASLSRGEVRRLKNILRLPRPYLDIIREEQDLPRTKQTLTVDHLLEVTRGAAALERAKVLGEGQREELERSLIEKFQGRKLVSTVEPRLLTRMARAVTRDDVPREVVTSSVERLISDPRFTVSEAYDQSVSQAEDEHNLEMLTKRLITKVTELSGIHALAPTTRETLRELRTAIDRLLSGV